LPCDRRRRGGFTLPEILIALTIMSLAAGMALPLLAKRAPVASLAGATAEMRAALAAARSAAIAEDREIIVAASADGYRIDGRNYRFPAASLLTVAIRGGTRIAFFPSGGSSGGRIILRAAARERAIAVDAISGRAVVLR